MSKADFKVIIAKDGKATIKDVECSCGGRFVFTVWGGLFCYIECDNCGKLWEHSNLYNPDDVRKAFEKKEEESC